MTEPNHTFGMRLRMRREYLGLSREEISLAAHLPFKQLEALEEGRFEDLPARVYVNGFVRSLLETLEVPEREAWFREFDAEWEARPRKAYSSAPLQARGGIAGKPFTARHAGYAALAAAGIVIIGFFVIRFVDFTGNPRLSVSSPAADSAFGEPSVRVSGRTEKESRLTVNGRELTIDNAGNFDETIEVPPGANVLEFRAVNRFGKESAITRNIVVK